MEITHEMLANAVRKAVELDLLPKFSSEEEYLKQWDNIKKILEAAKECCVD